jgi:hypothetical protein
MVPMHEMRDSCSLSRMVGEGWGEGASALKAAPLRPSDTSPRKREEDSGFCTSNTSGVAL